MVNGKARVIRGEGLNYTWERRGYMTETLKNMCGGGLVVRGKGGRKNLFEGLL